MYNARPDSPPLERFEVKPPSSIDSTLPLPPPPLPPPPRSNDIAPAGSGTSGRAGQRTSKTAKTQSDAVIISFLANFNRPDIAQNAYERPLGDDSEDEAGNSSPPRSDMTAAYEQSSIHHFSHRHGLRGMSAHPLREDPMSATRPRSGGTAHLDLIMNSDSNPPGQLAPRLDTSQQTLAQSSVGAHVLPGPLPSASTPPPSSSTLSRSSPKNPPTLPSLGSFAPSLLAARELPPLPGSHHFGTGSALPSPASDMASSVRTSQLPSIGKQFSATTPPLSYRSQPSPTISLRSPHQGPTSAVSPPAHFSMPAVRSKPLSPQSEATTPASAFSVASFQSPNGSLASGADVLQMDGSRPVLPPLPTAHGMCTPGVVFKCKHPSCTAAPFQTQYLLNSHMNVHSSSRPHYCPRKGCPRGEGGKGFKRKNEMIRHGLVHQSPGYACPFCPDREHKYPRPDNLQRHVKVHHVDKNKDDPVLRDVLNQRLDGGSRGRRRRANS